MSGSIQAAGPSLSTTSSWAIREPSPKPQPGRVQQHPPEPEPAVEAGPIPRGTKHPQHAPRRFTSERVERPTWPDMIAALPVPANDMADDPHGQYREIIARLEGQDRRLDEIREDAREGRDAAVRMAERYAAEGVPTKLAELRGEMEKGFQAARTDLVNSTDKTTREMREAQSSIHKRLEALEQFKQRIEGAGGVFGWIARNAPWLLTAVLAALAAVGFRDNV